MQRVTVIPKLEPQGSILDQQLLFRSLATHDNDEQLVPLFCTWYSNSLLPVLSAVQASIAATSLYYQYTTYLIV